MEASQNGAGRAPTFRRIDASALRRTRDPAGPAFETTAELEDLPLTLGQTRAVEAIGFGIGMPHPGHSL